MSSFPQLPVADCPQLPVAERTSAEELQLIFEVESLQMQLSKAGHPVNARIEEIFIQSVTPNTTHGANQELESQKGSFAKNASCSSASDTTTGPAHPTATTTASFAYNAGRCQQ